ncbi:hypothetical protein CEXT_72541 [Caerostris extrusa]|uniref:Apple domain-containing protein n=1 Tax=Caerostris extrusa TaxID=172846 RepID=A0AAV4XRH0_CAEEX|nr:hypothetical protein CEXT_72541 [Caerostris extrusa]
MTERRAPNKMHCAAYCTKESHCKAFGIDTKIFVSCLMSTSTKTFALTTPVQIRMELKFISPLYYTKFNDLNKNQTCTWLIWKGLHLEILKGPPKPTTDALPTGRTGSINEIEHPNQGIPIVPTVTVPFVVQKIPVVTSVPVTASNLEF